ncbi:MAG: hypothetical protein GY757_46180, partial [bacterium]|nr:hypothetical protein [bacterium]
KALTQIPISKIQTQTQTNSPPRNEIEEKLVEIWAVMLGIQKGDIGIDDNFFQLGGHSIKAIVMTARMQNDMGCTVALPQLFKTPTIRGLAAFIAGQGEKGNSQIPPVETKEHYPLSQNQQRMYILNKMQPGSPAYNMPGQIEIHHSVDEEAAKQVITQLMERHESFRTTFKIIKNQPRQYIMPAATIETPFETADISYLSPEAKENAAAEIYETISTAPFDLRHAPLLRVTLVKMEAQRYRLMFNMHHIISDGWSLRILKREYQRKYESNRAGNQNEPEHRQLRYIDFVQWDNRRLTGHSASAGTAGEEAARYWENKLLDGLPVSGLLPDNQTPKEDNEGAAYRSVIAKETVTQLKELAEKNQTTLFTEMFSVYLLLLTRLTGQEESCCSVIVAGREHPALQSIIGFFVNSVLIRITMDENETFNRYQKRVAGEMQEALRHQGYPLESVCDRLGIRYPEIPLAFNFLNLEENNSGPGEADGETH